MSDHPIVLQEFSTIAGLILGRVYSNVPMPVDVDFSQIASSMGLPNTEAALESGRRFLDVAAHTHMWLINNKYVNGAGLLPRDRATLTDKGLAAMMSKPDAFSEAIGTTLSKAGPTAASTEGRNRFVETIGTLIGSTAGSFAKSLGSG